MIVSPSEPEPLRTALADITSWMPERYGVDFFFTGAVDPETNLARKVGIQRKEYKDLIASVTDGRLVKEIHQMQALDYRVLIIEGKLEWTTDGKLILPYSGQSTWSQAQWNGLILSIMDRGVFVLHTASMSETISLIRIVESWFGKSSHSSLAIRPSVKPLWGQGLDDEAFAKWFLQGIPNVGDKLAGRIYEKFGIPFELSVTVEDLQQVEGIGKKKAEDIVRLFNGTP